MVSATEIVRAKRSILSSSHRDIGPPNHPYPAHTFCRRAFRCDAVPLPGRRRQGNAANCLCSGSSARCQTTDSGERNLLIDC